MSNPGPLPGRPSQTAETPKSSSTGASRNASQEYEVSTALLREYTRTRDVEIRNQLVLRYSRLVHYLASRFSSNGVTGRDDLIQVGYMGLISAIERYDPEAGGGFTTFAMVTIRGVIQHYLRDHTWGLKAPRRLRELATRLRRLRDELEQSLGRPPSIDEMAEAACVTRERLLEAMEVDQLYQPTSLDAYRNEDSGDGKVALRDSVGGDDPGYDGIEERELVRWALGTLDERERSILFQRFFHEASQAEVAGSLGISQMHVSRLERKALSRLRALLS